MWYYECHIKIYVNIYKWEQLKNLILHDFICAYILVDGYLVRRAMRRNFGSKLFLNSISNYKCKKYSPRTLIEFRLCGCGVETMTAMWFHGFNVESGNTTSWHPLSMYVGVCVELNGMKQQRKIGREEIINKNLWWMPNVWWKRVWPNLMFKMFKIQFNFD